MSNTIESVFSSSSEAQNDWLKSLKDKQIWFPYKRIGTTLHTFNRHGIVVSSNNDQEAMSYAEAMLVKESQYHHGVGISLTLANDKHKQGIVVFDLDAFTLGNESLSLREFVSNPGAKLALDLIGIANTYTERSGSRTGFHLIFAGLPHFRPLDGLETIKPEKDPSLEGLDKTCEIKALKKGFTPITGYTIDWLEELSNGVDSQHGNPFNKDENFANLCDKLRCLSAGIGEAKRRESEWEKEKKTPDDSFVQDVLFNLPKEWVHSREHWIRVGMALHTLGNEYLPKWKEWSKGTTDNQYANYSDEACETAWNSFKSDGKLKFGYLVKHAVQNGMVIALPDDLDLKNLLSHTDFANAKRVLAEHSDTFRFVPRWNEFIYWDGEVWRMDTGRCQIRNAIQRTMEDLAERWKSYLVSLDSDMKEDEKRKKTIRAFLQRSQNANARDAVIRELTGFPEITLDYQKINANPYLFNFANGTAHIDVKANAITLRPFDRNDFLMQKSLLPFVPEQPSEEVMKKWHSTISGCISPESRAYAEECFALAFIGAQLEQKIVILKGRGNNGKSTLLVIVQILFGDYGESIAKKVLEGKPTHPTEVAVMFGKRFVTCSEIEEKLEASTAKAISGGDILSVRQCGEDPWTFRPSHILVLCCNVLPRLTEATRGMLRRLVVIPAENATFDDGNVEKDKQLREWLPKDEEFLRAASWALVSGLRRYLGRGLQLQASEEVKRATKKYVDSASTFARFVDECCKVEENAIVPLDELYKLRIVWCIANGEKYEHSKQKFAEVCDIAGYETPVQADERGRVGGVVVKGGLIIKSLARAIVERKDHQQLFSMSGYDAKNLLDGVNVFNVSAHTDDPYAGRSYKDISKGNVSETKEEF